MSKTRQFLRKLLNVTATQCWALVSKPWKIPMIFSISPLRSHSEAICALFPDLPLSIVEECRLEFLRNHAFFTELNKNLVEKRHRRINSEEREFLYMAVRFTKPHIVFETGVFDGESSAVILQALHDNGHGVLVSIDLPATKMDLKGTTRPIKEVTLPPRCQPGWVIPDYLRGRHRLVLGDSKELLGPLFKEYPTIDVFFHDSLHTFDHQYFEYKTAYPHLSEGGFLLSDDIFWSPAFHKFCREHKKKYVCVGNFIYGFGAVKK